MAIEFKDYYQVLGVSPKATDQEIKKAFRALARKYHPDVAKDKKAAEDKFKQINEANEVLSNPESRKKYDQLGSNWKAEGQPQYSQERPHGSRSTRQARGEDAEFHFEGTGFSDFFEQFFGGRASGAGSEAAFDDGDGPWVGRPPAAARRGQDVHGDISITLEEVLKGAMRSISFKRTDPQTGHESTETHQVRIPAGVREGQSIRVQGKGGAGLGDGKAGDILLRVRYAANPDWTCRGTDLVGELNLAPWEAVLGATVPVVTLDGAVKVKVPPGTQQGHQLRIRGKGLPIEAGKRGDLYVGVVIQVPAATTKGEEELWRQLSSQSSFNPRER